MHANLRNATSTQQKLRQDHHLPSLQSRQMAVGLVLIGRYGAKHPREDIAMAYLTAEHLLGQGFSGHVALSGADVVLAGRAAGRALVPAHG